MQVVEAAWDTRNLGVKSAELLFGVDDGQIDLDEIRVAMAGYEYCVAKVPVGIPGLYSALGRLGFAFAECLIDFEHSLKGLLEGRLSHAVASGASVERILARVSEGVFETDRVFLDSQFGPERAAQRYVNWICDELAAGAILYEVSLGRDPAGFFAYKETSPGVSYPFLIGLYPEFRGSGFGVDLIAASLAASKENGCTMSCTTVSSNNPAVIRCHERVGSKVRSAAYVFTRHSADEGITL